jgi:DNA-binding transcriptional ArsR family regulator
MSAGRQRQRTPEGEHTRLQLVERGSLRCGGPADRSRTFTTTARAGTCISATCARMPATPRSPRAGKPGVDADEDKQLWAAVAGPLRRRLLDVLDARGEVTPTVLARDLPFSRQAVAKHVAVLERAGLVESRRQGREVHYVIVPNVSPPQRTSWPNTLPAGTNALQPSSASRKPFTARRLSALKLSRTDRAERFISQPEVQSAYRELRRC